jgi:hypothetical protein
MNKKHPLLERAQKYVRQKVNLAPAGCVYDKFIGAWKLISTGELWVETPNRVGPRTKKQDIETGEDQKGE